MEWKALQVRDPGLNKMLWKNLEARWSMAWSEIFCHNFCPLTGCFEHFRVRFHWIRHIASYGYRYVPTVCVRVLEKSEGDMRHPSPSPYLRPVDAHDLGHSLNMWRALTGWKHLRMYLKNEKLGRLRVCVFGRTLFVCFGGGSWVTQLFSHLQMHPSL